ncbi:MAG TPA: hypothetical protein VFA60_00820 [Terriglobales bacterium]|nr:hypothetical protein [Terriglobales bacterium]
MSNNAEVAGVLLNFFGGVILAIDALSAESRDVVDEGTKAATEDAAAAGVPVRTGGGRPLSYERFRRGVVRHSVVLARLGFGLMTLGFGCDLYSKLG